MTDIINIHICDTNSPKYQPIDISVVSRIKHLVSQSIIRQLMLLPVPEHRYERFLEEIGFFFQLCYDKLLVVCYKCRFVSGQSLQHANMPLW